MKPKVLSYLNSFKNLSQDSSFASHFKKLYTAFKVLSFKCKENPTYKQYEKKYPNYLNLSEKEHVQLENISINEREQ